MALLGETTLTRRRKAAGSFVAGRWSGGGATDSSFLGSVQPLGGKDRQVLDEGVRTRDGRVIYCTQGTLRTEDQHAGVPADQVLIGGNAFTVVHVDDSHPLIPHDRAFVLRAQEAE